MRKFYSNSQYIHIDGMALVLIGRLLGKPFEKMHRVTYVDWVRPLMSFASEEGLKVLFLGSRPGVAQKAAMILKKELPQLKLEAQHGYFSTEKESKENKGTIGSSA